jgi:hypothetical protein
MKLPRNNIRNKYLQTSQNGYGPHHYEGKILLQSLGSVSLARLDYSLLGRDTM